jgi:hypothetical protein
VTPEQPPRRLRFWSLFVGTITVSGTVAGLAIANMDSPSPGMRLAITAVVPVALLALCVFWIGYSVGGHHARRAQAYTRRSARSGMSTL